MSQTPKKTKGIVLASTIVLLAPFTAQAQDAATAQSILDAVTRSMGGQTASSADIRMQIEDRVKTLMTDIQQTAASAETSTPVTIEEIDQMNRSAERERTAIEFEQARLRRTQLEIERLMALYEVIKTLEEDEKAVAAERQRQLSAVAEAASQANSPAETGNAVEDDAKLLPRIDSISGIGGTFTAEAEFENATFKTLKVGDQTPGGFVVEEINAAAVVLKGPASKALFRLNPKAPPPPVTPDMENIGNVLDLSQFPMAQF